MQPRLQINVRHPLAIIGGLVFAAGDLRIGSKYNLMSSTDCDPGEQLGEQFRCE